MGFVAGARASCRSGRGGREGKLKKKKALNGKTELIACGQHVPYRLREAAGAHARGSGWAAVEMRRGVSGWRIPRHQQAGGIWRCAGHE